MVAPTYRHYVLFNFYFIKVMFVITACTASHPMNVPSNRHLNDIRCSRVARARPDRSDTKYLFGCC